MQHKEDNNIFAHCKVMESMYGEVWRKHYHEYRTLLWSGRFLCTFHCLVQQAEMDLGHLNLMSEMLRMMPKISHFNKEKSCLRRQNYSLLLNGSFEVIELLDKKPFLETKNKKK